MKDELNVRAGTLFDLSRARLSRADFEVASYLWLDVLEVDINVGYCKHLTVRISIRRQPDAQPLERVKRVTLRRTSSRRAPREECIIVDAVAATRSMHSLDQALRECTQHRKCTQTSTIASRRYLFTYLFLGQLAISR